MTERCRVCGAEVKVQIQKNTGLCSQRCGKAVRIEHDDRCYDHNQETGANGGSWQYDCICEITA